jgi:hypothetical protein
VLDPPHRFKYGHLAQNRRTLVGDNGAEGARFPNAHF